MKTGLIDYSKCPRVFTDDNAERGIFRPDTGIHCTMRQLLALQSDARYYTDRHGPDECPHGLKASARARAVLKWIARNHPDIAAMPDQYDEER
jgi:hypothetical protein